jgi:hypothetical protein
VDIIVSTHSVTAESASGRIALLLILYLSMALLRGSSLLFFFSLMPFVVLFQSLSSRERALHRGPRRSAQGSFNFFNYFIGKFFLEYTTGKRKKIRCK